VVPTLNTLLVPDAAAIHINSDYFTSSLALGGDHITMAHSVAEKSKQFKPSALRSCWSRFF